MARIKLGNLSGDGIISWADDKKLSVTYNIDGFYDQFHHSVTAEGTVFNSTYNALYAPMTKSGVKLTLSDGRVIDVSIKHAGSGETYGVIVNSVIDEFLKSAPQK